MSTKQRFGGNWTIEKLSILSSYLNFYITALKKQPFKKKSIENKHERGNYSTPNTSLLVICTEPNMLFFPEIYSKTEVTRHCISRLLDNNIDRIMEPFKQKQLFENIYILLPGYINNLILFGLVEYREEQECLFDIKIEEGKLPGYPHCSLCSCSGRNECGMIFSYHPVIGRPPE